MILNKTTIILSVMEIFIFVWKTSKQAVTDNQNQNLHSNESFFLTKKNNSHSSSAKEQSSLTSSLLAWGVGFCIVCLFAYIAHSLAKFSPLWGWKASSKQETHQKISFLFRILSRMNERVRNQHQHKVLEWPLWVDVLWRCNVFPKELELLFSCS